MDNVKGSKFVRTVPVNSTEERYSQVRVVRSGSLFTLVGDPTFFYLGERAKLGSIEEDELRELRDRINIALGEV